MTLGRGVCARSHSRLKENQLKTTKREGGSTWGSGSAEPQAPPCRDGQPGDALHWVVHRQPLSGPETRGPCTRHERIAKAKPQVVFAVEYLPLHSFLDYWSSVEQRWEGRERSCVTGHRAGLGAGSPSLLLILLLLSSEGANCLIYLFISQS